MSPAVDKKTGTMSMVIGNAGMGEALCGEPLEGVTRIAVLRPSAVGDFVFALPALHALKHSYPNAELVYIGKPWHAQFLHGRPGPVDRVEILPPFPGVGAPLNETADADAIEAFLQRMRSERFDIAVQMFGGGRHSNPFIAGFGARLSVGPRAADAPPLDRWITHAEPGNRRLALLEVAALAGAQAPLPWRELAVTATDREEAARVLPPEPARPSAVLSFGLAQSATLLSPERGQSSAMLPPEPAQSSAVSPPELAQSSAVSPPELAQSSAMSQPEPAQSLARPLPKPVPSLAMLSPEPEKAFAVLQPGSTDARRCWPPERFAQVGDALASRGVRVAINGTAQEARRVEEVRAAMRHPSIGLAGRLSLGGLCGLLERASVIVSNDTGPLHLALAIGKPCVGIFWHTNLADGMPLRPSLLRAAVSARQHCPVCGADNRAFRCRHDVSFVDEVTVAQVLTLTLSLLRAPPR